MRVYLDNCCFNRPFDDQGQIRIRLEAEAKLYIQDLILGGRIELAWSYVLDYETSANPFEQRRRAIAGWRERAMVDVEETPGILHRAGVLSKKGVKSLDALHVACAVEAECDYLLTTDDALLKRAKSVADVRVLDPMGFIREVNQ